MGGREGGREEEGGGREGGREEEWGGREGGREEEEWKGDSYTEKYTSKSMMLLGYNSKMWDQIT